MPRKPISEETRNKMRLAKLGKPSHLKGVKLSNEHIEKLRQSHLGKVPWNKGVKMPEVSERMKGKKYMLGKKHSQETKDKIAKAHLGIKQNFPAWNKGMKGYGFGEKPENRYTGEVWNKGMKGFRAGEKRPGVMPRGENHFAYIKDRSLLKRYNRRNDPAYKGWRADVYRRDNYQCKINNSECNGRIEAHHILSYKDYPELRYDINNGITLCKFHHPRTRILEKQLSPYFNDLIKETN